jgi:hypothetical protein
VRTFHERMAIRRLERICQLTVVARRMPSAPREWWAGRPKRARRGCSSTGWGFLRLDEPARWNGAAAQYERLVLRIKEWCLSAPTPCDSRRDGIDPVAGADAVYAFAATWAIATVVLPDDGSVRAGSYPNAIKVTGKPELDPPYSGLDFGQPCEVAACISPPDRGGTSVIRGEIAQHRAGGKFHA